MNQLTSTMLITSILINIALAFAVWRLKGSRTVEESVKVVVQGGGGPGPLPPPPPPAPPPSEQA